MEKTKRKKFGVFEKLNWKPVMTDINTVPQQEHSEDSGVFACAFAEYMSSGNEKINFTKADITRLRGKIALSIINEDYFQTFFGA